MSTEIKTISREKQSKITTTIRVSPDMHHKLRKLAHKQNRSMGNLMETLFNTHPLLSAEIEGAA